MEFRVYGLGLEVKDWCAGSGDVNARPKTLTHIQAQILNPKPQPKTRNPNPRAQSPKAPFSSPTCMLQDLAVPHKNILREASTLEALKPSPEPEKT